MSLKNDILLRIKDEIITDPQGVGYLGKTDAEITKLLNEPIKRTKIVVVEESPPIVRLLAGVNAPNTVSEQDVTESKLL